MNEITFKNWLGRLICKHKNTGWYTKKSMFYSLAGETQYKICKDCGKQVDTHFIKYD